MFQRNFLLSIEYKDLKFFYFSFFYYFDNELHFHIYKKKCKTSNVKIIHEYNLKIFLKMLIGFRLLIFTDMMIFRNVFNIP